MFTAIEDDYVGPKLEDGKVTTTFVKELMQAYKDQKKLHRKYAYHVSIGRDNGWNFPGLFYILHCARCVRYEVNV